MGDAVGEGRCRGRFNHLPRRHGQRTTRDRLSTVFANDDATGKLQAAWLVKEQLRTLLATGSLADAGAAKNGLQSLVRQAAQAETNLLRRTVCRWWKETEVLIATGATTAKGWFPDIHLKQS